MPLVFSQDEIREFLAEMGYGDLNDDDLERFVKDLQKLIRTESKQRRRRRLGHTGHTRSDFSTTDESSSVPNRETDGDGTTSLSGEDSRPRLLFTPKSKLPKKRPKPRRVEDSSDFVTSNDFTSDSNPLSTTSNTNGQRTNGSYTESSMSSVPLQERNFIPRSEADGRVQREGKPRSFKGPPLGEQNQLPRVVMDGMDGGEKLRKTRPSFSASSKEYQKDSKVDEGLGSSSSSSGTLSDTDLLCLMEHILKNDLAGAIAGAGDGNGESAKKKIEIPAKIRRDPVALYHWYKTFWDKQKPPGEDRHMQLRWNVRAGTVGRFPCDADGLPINYLPMNPVKPKKKTVSAF